MSNLNLYEALEICLQDIEKGADVEAVLFRYPDLADELRPILEASAGAKSMAVPMPSPEVVQRNRARILQHAAQMREVRVKPLQRVWFASLRRLTVTVVVVVALFVSGTGLVRAAADTLPGDNLYPVKRTWEDLSLFLTFDSQLRETLEVERENERVYELQKLLAEGRSAEVDFSGWVTRQNGNEWVVSPGITVVLSDQTEVQDGPIVVNNAVRVRGWTQENGIVLAERVRLLDSDAKLPDLDNEPEIEVENNNEGPSHQEEDNSGPGSGDDAPRIEETPESAFEPKEESFEGVVASIENNTLVVNGIEVDISRAEIRVIPRIGLFVKVDGYYDANGVFIVTRIEFQDNNSGSNNSNDNSNNDGGGSNDNSGSDGSSGNDNDNSNEDGGNDSGGGSDNDNGNDSGGDNSSSGGGGDGSED